MWVSEGVARASQLLSTRVDITHERQNQALLESMDRRAKMQLRLQQTVEGLSVAAITYYVVGLIGYGARGLKGVGVELNPDLAMGLSHPRCGDRDCTGAAPDASCGGRIYCRFLIWYAKGPHHLIVRRSDAYGGKHWKSSRGALRVALDSAVLGE